MSMHSRTRDYPTDVYRLFDADGQLLYVGVGANGYARLEAHRRERSWWPTVARVRMEQYANRSIALHVEACAIRDENPLHNVTRNYIGAEVRPLQRAPVAIETHYFEVSA